MKVALIGSNSFLAQYIIRELLNNNSGPVLFGEFPSPEFPQLNFSLFRIPDAPIVLPELLQFDLIIYTAGAGIQADRKETLEIIYELNSFLPIKIINYLTTNNFKGKIITFGSYFEIGNESEERFYTETGVALSERSVPNHYAASKRILTRYLYSAPDLPDHYHLILPNIYGKGESPNRLIPYILDSVRKGIEITLTSGAQVRQYIHATDNARTVVHIAKNDFPKGLYNLCNPHPVQIRSLAETILRIIGKESYFDKLHFGTNQRTDTVMPYLLLNNDKVQRVMSIIPSVSLEEGIKSYI